MLFWHSKTRITVAVAGSLTRAARRHRVRFSVLGGGFWVSSHVQLVAREVHIIPRNMLGLANSQPAVSEEAYKICAILRLPRASAADYFDKLQEFFAGTGAPIVSARPHPTEARSGIVKARPGANRLIEDRSQRADAVVEDAGGVPLLITAEPNFAIALRHLAHIGGRIAMATNGG